ncbi:MAG: 60S ribosomal protein L31 [Candidatus Aenigmarchaeota archaeon]|nr:60S ribosomal protein L31 [Candidatus Aenigmarchaeota archaeon]
MADEKIYTVNLTQAWNSAYKKRAKKSIYVIKEYLKRHKNAKIAKVAPYLNEEIWARGAKNPPRSVKIQIVKEKDDIFWAELAGVKFELPQKPETKKEEKPKEEPVKEESKPKDEKKKDASVKPEKKAEEPAKPEGNVEKKPIEPEAKKEEKALVKEADKEPVKAEKEYVAPPVKKAEDIAKPVEAKPETKTPVKESSEKKE